MEPAIFSLGIFGSDKFIKTDTSTLLHPFEDEAEVHRKLNSQVFVGLKDVEPSQDGTLVVRGTAPDELAVIGDGQSERIGVPSVALKGLDSKRSVPLSRNPLDNHGAYGLNVEVTVKEDRLLLRILTNLSQYCRRKLDFMTFEGFDAEIF